MRYRRTKRDANHAAIVDNLRQIGCTVIDLAAVGSQVPDILVGFGGRNYLLEIKNPARDKKTQATRVSEQKQRDFHAAWKGHVAIVETFNDAFKELHR